MILSEDPTAKVVDLGKPVEANMRPLVPPNVAGTASGPPLGAPPVRRPTSGRSTACNGPDWTEWPARTPPSGLQPPGAAETLDPEWLEVLLLARRLRANGGSASPSHSARAPPAPPVVFDHAVISYEVSKPLIKVCGVPPEEMRLDRYARSFATSRIVGHERVVPVDQLHRDGLRSRSW